MDKVERTPEEKKAILDRMHGIRDATKPRLGSRQKMTKEMLIRMEQLMSTGKTPTEILWDWTQRDDVPMDLKLKSVFKLVDLIYPKAASVEVKVEDDKPKDTTTVDRMINEKLKALGIDTENDEIVDEEDSEEE